MADFYANEQFPYPVVHQLRSMGHNVTTTHESGKSNRAISDEAVLRHAIQYERAVLTLNVKDFVHLHFSGSGHWGIIVCTDERDFSAQATGIDEAVRQVSNLRNRLVRVTSSGYSVEELQHKPETT